MTACALHQFDARAARASARRDIQRRSANADAREPDADAVAVRKIAVDGADLAVVLRSALAVETGMLAKRRAWNRQQSVRGFVDAEPFVVDRALGDPFGLGAGRLRGRFSRRGWRTRPVATHRGWPGGHGTASRRVSWVADGDDGWPARRIGARHGRARNLLGPAVQVTRGELCAALCPLAVEVRDAARSLATLRELRRTGGGAQDPPDQAPRFGGVPTAVVRPTHSGGPREVSDGADLRELPPERPLRGADGGGRRGVVRDRDPNGMGGGSGCARRRPEALRGARRGIGARGQKRENPRETAKRWRHGTG